MTRLADLTSTALGELLARSAPVVVALPVGAVEPHGPHAPLGTDTLISEGMCERAAAALAPDVELLVAPAIPYGVTRYAAGFAGAVGVDEDALVALVGGVCRSLADNGMRRVVIVNNHFEPEHVAALRGVAQAQAGVALLDLTRRRLAAQLPQEFQEGSCHAGRYETSLVLADAPALIDDARRAALPELPVDMPAAIAAGRASFQAMGMDAAYCGAPAQASAQEGEATFATLATLLAEAARELC